MRPWKRKKFSSSEGSFVFPLGQGVLYFLFCSRPWKWCSSPCIQGLSYPTFLVCLTWTATVLSWETAELALVPSFFDHVILPGAGHPQINRMYPLLGQEFPVQWGGPRAGAPLCGEVAKAMFGEAHLPHSFPEHSTVPGTWWGLHICLMKEYAM